MMLLRVRAYALALLAVLVCCAASACFATAAPACAWGDEAGESAAAPGEVAALDTSYVPDNVEFLSEGAARFEGVPFGISAFERIAKGTQRAGEGMPAGYRIPIQADANFAVVRTPEQALVYVDQGAAGLKDSGLTSTPEHASAFWSMVLTLDEAGSMSGPTLTEEAPKPLLCTRSTVVVGPYRYRFDAEDADGNRYVTVTPAALAEHELTPDMIRATGLDLGDGARWVDSGIVVPATGLAGPASQSALDQALSFVASIDMRPLWVSLKTGVVALAISFVLGLLAAWRVMGTSSRLKGVLDSVFTIPMVLPPTVCGFLLLMLFGNSTAMGRWLVEHGIEVVFTWQAAVIAAVVVSFPLVYRTALGAFEGLDASMLDAARTLGWSEWRIFRFITLPLAWPSIAAGTVLAFARAMGEFGCTLFFAGNYAGITQTIPIAIYFEWMGGNTDVALFWVVVVIAFSFLVVLGINSYTARQQAYRTGAPARARRGGAARKRDAAPSARPLDEIDAMGGDAVRIDQRALAELLAESGADGNGGA
ncbi:MAG: molybdate ABC transporter permease subunit [Coriobacteriaceae bacterium]|nr:molybdate ABC transporter permease subunit [Coriobacteriaceae bacterium]